MKYKIIHNNLKEEVVGLSGLSQKLTMGCEIIEMNGVQEKSLGHCSKRLIESFALKVYENCMTNYSNITNQLELEAQKKVAEDLVLKKEHPLLGMAVSIAIVKVIVLLIPMMINKISLALLVAATIGMIFVTSSILYGLLVSLLLTAATVVGIAFYAWNKEMTSQGAMIVSTMSSDEWMFNI